jgi:hypothetical protein
MNVVAHQTVRKDAHVGVFEILATQAQVGVTILAG